MAILALEGIENHEGVLGKHAQLIIQKYCSLVNIYWHNSFVINLNNHFIQKIFDCKSQYKNYCQNITCEFETLLLTENEACQVLLEIN